jgi:uncharacterized membrane protein
VEAFTLLRWLHVIGTCVLLGTGVGIVFSMLMAHRSRDVAVIAHTARVVVVADYIFAASAVIAQPITGYLLARAVDWSLCEPWLVLSLALYLVIGLCLLPVLCIQIRIRDIAAVCVVEASPLPPRYFALFRRWFYLGISAFVSVLAIVWLLLARPIALWR